MLFSSQQNQRPRQGCEVKNITAHFFVVNFFSLVEINLLFCHKMHSTVLHCFYKYVHNYGKTQCMTMFKVKNVDNYVV